MSKLWEQVRRLLMMRRHNYRLAFLSPPGQVVLRDLARFCRAHKSTFHEDPRVHAMAEGRREVWLRIQQHLHMKPDDLWALYAGLSDVTKEDE
jgi:predicted alpha/beta hydrolase